MKLTARQIKYFDELAVDRSSAKLTLNAALGYHSNRLNEIIKKEHELWDELVKQHDLDPALIWTAKSVDGSVVIIEATEQEKSDG